MKWIRCNNCYARADLAKEPFTLTTCGHVYCTRCTIQAERRCLICGAVNVPTMRLEQPLDPAIGLYLSPLRDQINQILTIHNFQEEQVRISMKRFNELDAKYIHCKEVCRKLEIIASRLNKKCRNDKEEYVTKLRSMENENVQLKLALDKAQNRPYGNFRNDKSSASSLLNPMHTCEKRFEQNGTQLPFSTPMSTNTNASDRSSNSLLPESRGIFQIPNMNRVPRSAGTRSSASTVSTSSSMNPSYLRLNSLMISRS